MLLLTIDMPYWLNFLAMAAIAFGGWLPVVAVLEYATHRWIMHHSNRWLDPKQSQLKAHGAHHQGDDAYELLDMPIGNCAILTSPFFVITLIAGAITGAWTIAFAACVGLMAWWFVYAWLWTTIHRAIHEKGAAWFRKTGPIFNYFYSHHMKHHEQVTSNYGTVFPFTDYLFATVKREKQRAV